MTVAVLSAVAGAAIYIGQADGPRLSATAAIAVDVETGRVLWGKNAEASRYPASTTKVLTGLLLVENTEPTDVIVAPADTKTVRGSSLHMEPGETVSAGEALYALMLRSANDTAHAIAVHLAGSDEGFAAMMNRRATELGCTGTFFRTPHGLNDDYHVTTAHDLARLAVAAVAEQEFANVVSAQEHWITRSMNQRDLLLKNRNSMLTEDPSNAGIKTGYTNPAGQCFVGLHRYQGRGVVTVILQSTDWRSDQHALSDWLQQTFSFQKLATKGETVGQVSVLGGQSPTASVTVSTDVQGYVSKADLEGAVLRASVDHVAPVLAGQDLGPGSIELADGTSFAVDIRSLDEVKRRFDPSAIFRNPVALLVLGGSALLTHWMRKRALRPRRTSAARPR